MKLGKLKELIKDLPDDTDILSSGSDHSYRLAGVQITQAAYITGPSKSDKEITEWFGNSADYELSSKQSLEVKQAIVID